jgi:nitrogen-specific signal transduction histidine kinase
MADQAKVNPGGLDARTLAHELNNDLGIIIAECELLEGTLKQEEASARVKAIRIAACRMADRISANPSPSASSTAKSKKPSQRPSH